MRRPNPSLLRRCAAAVALLALGPACKHEPTRDDVRAANKDTASKLVASIEAVRALVDAAPAQPLGAPCEKKGLSLDVMPDLKSQTPAGNTNIAEVRELLPGSVLGPDNQSYKGALADKLNAGPSGSAVLLARWLSDKTTDPAVGKGSGAQEAAAFARVPAITYLVVTRAQSANGLQADVFLFELPAAKLVCGFGVASDTDEQDKKANDLGYDFRTGEPLKELKFASYDDKLASTVNNVIHQVQVRFGLPMRPEMGDPLAPPADPALDKVRAHYAQMVSGLAGNLGECTDAPPAGAVRTTTKRLMLAGGLPPPPKSEPDVRVEPGALVSEPFKGFLSAERKAQGDLGAKLMAAPATLVVDVVTYKPATFSEVEKVYAAGEIVVRQVRFDGTGKAVCATAARLRNSDNLNVTSYYGSTSEETRTVAADLDLRAQIEAYFKDPSVFASMPGAAAAVPQAPGAPKKPGAPK